MKNKIICILIGIILMFNLVLVSSDVTVVPKEISLLDGKILGHGIEYKELQDEGIKLTFVNEGASVNIGGDIFQDIVPQGKAGHPTEIELDKSGGILRADFTVNEKGGTYVFGNTQIYAPPNSRVFFDKKTGLEYGRVGLEYYYDKRAGINIVVPDGSEFKEIPKPKTEGVLTDYVTTIKSIKYGSFKLPSGDIVTSGELSYENGQPFISYHNKKAIIDNVGIDNVAAMGSRVYLYFDGQRHDQDYVSFNLKNKKLILSSSSFIDNPSTGFYRVSFYENNPFLKIEPGDHVVMRTDNSGEIEIQNRDATGLVPKVTTRGGYTLDQDHKSIYFWYNKDGVPQTRITPKESILVSSPLDASTSPMELSIFDENNQKILPKGLNIFVDNSNKITIGSYTLSGSEAISPEFSARIKYVN
ncbi:hypothetical protein HYT25_04720, partial [Candidatus Pacearchaeota archaeon]|nr:hypothetical protein [Candidatus Pacearchaeota archaeon]